MSARTFFDTNVLVYLHDNDAPEKQARARELVREHGLARTAVVSTQVLQELYVTLTRKLLPPLPESEAEAQVRRFATWPVAPNDAALVLDSITLHRAERISMWDALIVAAARREACSQILSEDLNDGQDFGGVRVRNPFTG